MAFEDYYSLLGVARTSSIAEIRFAYRKLVLECHPDRHPGNAEAETRFKKAAMAYQTLSSEKSRALYDLKYDTFHEAQRQRSDALKTAPPSPPRRPIPRSRIEPGAPSRENRFLQTDTLRGLWLGSFFATVFSGWLAAGDINSLAWSLALPPTLLAAAAIGQKVRKIFEVPDVAREDWLDELVILFPSLFALLALSATSALSTPLGLPLRLEGTLWAAISGGGGATLGSAFGRAFWEPADSPRLKALALFVAATVAGATAVLATPTLILLSGGLSLELAVYDRLFAATGGASAGALVASLRGTWYKS